MCLYLKSRIPKYTVKDITVYKWLVSCNSGEIKSPFRKFRYELGKSYESPLMRSVSIIRGKYNLPMVSAPYFVYLPITDNYYIHHMRPSFALLRDEVDLGFHTLNSIVAAITYYRGCTSFKASLYECIIPKNSWYYEGTDNELASDHLIIKERISNGLRLL